MALRGHLQHPLPQPLSQHTEMECWDSSGAGDDCSERWCGEEQGLYLQVLVVGAREPFEDHQNCSQLQREQERQGVSYRAKHSPRTHSSLQRQGKEIVQPQQEQFPLPPPPPWGSPVRTLARLCCGSAPDCRGSSSEASRCCQSCREGVWSALVSKTLWLKSLFLPSERNL